MGSIEIREKKFVCGNFKSRVCFLSVEITCVFLVFGDFNHVFASCVQKLCDSYVIVFGNLFFSRSYVKLCDCFWKEKIFRSFVIVFGNFFVVASASGV